jgi:hypothetical protein
MAWVMGLPERIDLDGRLTGLQEIPIPLEFCTVNLCPSFDKALLRPRQTTAEAFDRIQSKDGGLALIVRVKMCALMRTACFDKHPNDYAKKPRQLRHLTEDLRSGEMVVQADVGSVSQPHVIAATATGACLPQAATE